jgi:hypothetical protein
MQQPVVVMVLAPLLLLLQLLPLLQLPMLLHLPLELTPLTANLLPRLQHLLNLYQL